MITTEIAKAVDALNRGEVVAIPTETVYGLAGNAFNSGAVQKIFDLKKRPLFNPLIIHIKSSEYLDQVAINIPPIAYLLANHFWPGPLTLVLEKNEKIPDIITAGKKTVAIRVPNHPTTLQLLEKLDFPLAAPSANPFGRISPTNAEHVAHFFNDGLEVILDGGQCELGIESTIIGFENEQAILYRHGSMEIEKIEKITGKLKIITKNDSTPEAPGMISKHYAPKTKMYLSENLHETIQQFADKRIGLITFQNRMENETIFHQEVLSESGNYSEAAKNLYNAMHRLDEQELDIIIAEKLPNHELGNTINDRLTRATK